MLTGNVEERLIVRVLGGLGLGGDAHGWVEDAHEREAVCGTTELGHAQIDRQTNRRTLRRPTSPSTTPAFSNNCQKEVAKKNLSRSYSLSNAHLSSMDMNEVREVTFLLELISP